MIVKYIKEFVKLTFNPFALLMALSGLRTRKTLNILMKDTLFILLGEIKHLLKHMDMTHYLYR